MESISMHRCGAVQKSSFGLERHAAAADSSDYFRDFFRFVLRRSNEALEGYASAAALLQDEETRLFFADLADVKRCEIDCLRHCVSTPGSFHAHESASRSASPFMGNSLPFASLEQACRFAFETERDTMELYHRLAELEEDLETKRLFLFLVEIEKSHLETIRSRMLLSFSPDEATSVSGW